MDPKRRIIWIGIWGVVLAGVFLMVPKKQKRNVEVSDQPSHAGRGNERITPTAPLEWRRDPFVLEEKTTSTRGSNRLTGIITDQIHKEQSFAIIDGQLVKVGDQVNGATVVEIRADRVILESNGEREELFLGDS